MVQTPEGSSTSGKQGCEITIPLSVQFAQHIGVGFERRLESRNATHLRPSLSIAARWRQKIVSNDTEVGSRGPRYRPQRRIQQDTKSLLTAWHFRDRKVRSDAENRCER